MVFGLRLRLDALAVGGGDGVDVLADRRGADEADAADGRVLEQDFGLFLFGGHHVDDALGQAGLVEHVEQQVAGQRHGVGGLEHEGVAAGYAERQHPAEGDHGREVEGSDAGEHAERLAVADRVVAGGHVHQRLALHEHRGADGDVDRLDDLDDLAAGLV